MQLSFVEYKFVELVNIVTLIIFFITLQIPFTLECLFSRLFVHDAACSLNKQNVNSLMNFLFIISFTIKCFLACETSLHSFKFSSTV